MRDVIELQSVFEGHCRRPFPIVRDEHLGSQLTQIESNTSGDRKAAAMSLLAYVTGINDVAKLANSLLESETLVRCVPCKQLMSGYLPGIGAG